MSFPFRLEILEGRAVYIGHQITTKLHTHHAVEIAMSFNEPFFISHNGAQFEESHCTVIAADTPHEFHGANDYYIFLYFDAETSQAIRLENKLPIRQHGILHYVGKEIEAAKERFKSWFFNSQSIHKSVAVIIDDLINAITPYPDTLNEIEPRMQDALRIIQQSLRNGVSIENIAAKVFLSESRFAHLFKEQTGIPFRKYVLWCRMQAAVKAVLQGQTFTQAAYEGGFADAAHLSRTFTEMFGVSPSDVLKQ